MPAFSMDFMECTSSPDNTGPKQNAMDYSTFLNSDDYPSKLVFNPEQFSKSGLVDEEMGIIPKLFVNYKDTQRSIHPFQSIAVNGNDSKFFTSEHPLKDPLLPIKKLYEREGYILLIGTDLDSCTAFHLAEEYAGRNSFIRWVNYPNKEIKEVFLNSCSDGFVNYKTYLKSICKTVKIGESEIKLYPIVQLVDMAVELIKEYPLLTLCPEDDGKGCFLCKDNVKGGPIN